MDDELAELDQLLGSLVALQQNLRGNTPPPPPLSDSSTPRHQISESPLPLPPDFGEYDDSSHYCVEDVQFIPITTSSTLASTYSHSLSPAVSKSNGGHTLLTQSFPPVPLTPLPFPKLDDQQTFSSSLPRTIPTISPPVPIKIEETTQKPKTNEFKNVVQSHELDSLLQELSVIEKEMRQIEDVEGDFNRRYSLVSSNGKINREERAVHIIPSQSDHKSLSSSQHTPKSQQLPRDEKGSNGLKYKSTCQKSCSELDSSHSSQTRSPEDAEKSQDTSSLPHISLSTSQSSQNTEADVIMRQTTTSLRFAETPREDVSHSISIDSHKRKADSMHIGRQGPFSMHELPEQRLSNLKKVVVRVFHQDRTTKAVMVDESCCVRETCNILIAKNYCCPNIKLALVEKVPSLKMEHCFEDHETLAECILNWPIDSQNMIFFEEREDKYGLFLKPQEWLGPSLLSRDIISDKHVIETIFGGVEPDLPEWNDFLYIKRPSEKSWSRKFCLVRNSGLYASKRKKSTTPCDLVRIMLFDNNFHLYTTTGGWTKLKAPTPYGFALKPYSAQDPHSKVVYYFCASDEDSFKTWITLIRIAKHGKQLVRNYECTKEDIERLRNEPPGLFSTTSGSAVRSSLSLKCFTRQSHPSVTNTLPRGARNRNPRLADYEHDVRNGAGRSDGGIVSSHVSHSPPRHRRGRSLKLQGNTTNENFLGEVSAPPPPPNLYPSQTVSQAPQVSTNHNIPKSHTPSELTTFRPC